MLKRVLLVEPDQTLAGRLYEAVRSVAEVHLHPQFQTARTHLLTMPFDFVITNLRLKAFNGLHLVHLAAAAELPTRAVVYTDDYDPALAKEIQRSGAFYEPKEALLHAIGVYLQSALPNQDRRNPAVRDRRNDHRSGRRCWDPANLRPEPAA
jgi:ActR/RegA family two-component response regulator